MNLVKRWNEYMGPKDERLEAVSNRCAKVGFMILLIGSVICCYYGMMLDQVALTTDTALATAVGFMPAIAKAKANSSAMAAP